MKAHAISLVLALLVGSAYAATTTLDCSVLSDPIQLERNKLSMRQAVNKEDNSVTIEVTLYDEAWVGVAFSPTGAMVPTTSVIGIPGQGVGLYRMNSKSTNGVFLMPQRAQRRLSGTSIVQESGKTILTFTLAVGLNGEAMAIGGERARIIYAYGKDNSLGYHASRGTADVLFGNCAVCSLSPIQLEESKLEMYQLVKSDNSVFVQMKLKDEAWVGFAFSPTGAMVPTTSVIGIPGQGVGLYRMNSKSTNGVFLMPDDDQDRLSNVSLVQEDGETILTFTLAVGSDGEAMAATDGDTSRIIYAYGRGNMLSYHASRSSADVVFSRCVKPE